ncbi:Mitotic checkpoint regulator, MAD2B-interacting-domain-containing protein [Coniochaeta hoffmannii]|uniref:Mitotic checkpoint regulator, MAD2B-interacting-domain-containing protein n=1 Tax=Coniochaeta hoffmannii TaxID=91930 RepID=A0AA38RW74_9PEZI|nr:Mitotic checkpoint regulator, MAD2B-interacting-domain-containing protein [Coniochaeta hoffmannii]
MGLVDYPDSDSEPEVQPQAPTKAPPKPTTNKPFQKFVDRSNPGKILVNLPTTSSSDAAEPSRSSDEPPAKRARTTGGSRFSAFSSFLPPPKKTTTATPAQTSGKPAPRPGVHLKTGAEPAFSREPSNDDDYAEDGSSSGATGGGGGLRLPPPKNHSSGSAAGPSIPEDQKPAEEVKLVGKPLMFKPLSVSRKPVKKKAFKASEASGTTATPKRPAEPAPSPAPEPPKKKISLFSIGAETESPATAETNPSGAYEPLFSSTEAGVPEPTYESYPTPSHAQPPPPPSSSSLSGIADDLNLTPQARRELFGRDGGAGAAAAAAARVVSFDMSREYEHNEALRQSGGAAAGNHNPVRSIKAGKHSLRQLVNAVQSNASALEESFAAQKGKKNEAGARYGWR